VSSKKGKVSMLKNLFNFKTPKTLPQAAVFYAICAAAMWVFATAAETWFTRGGF
jgi:hypothetical protein